MYVNCINVTAGAKTQMLNELTQYNVQCNRDQSVNHSNFVLHITKENFGVYKFNQSATSGVFKRKL